MSIRVARSGDLHGDGPHGITAAGAELVVVRTKSGLRAFDGRCPHQGALLTEGEVDGEALVCRNHRWRFRVEDGQRIGGSERLTPCPIREAGGEIFVDEESLPRDAAGRARVTRRIQDLPGPAACLSSATCSRST
jgi:nitrite reductase/ring-hydroxylating ferredoxin subunit